MIRRTLVGLSVLVAARGVCAQEEKDLSVITCQNDVSALFCMTAPQLTAAIDAAITAAQQEIDKILAVQPERRSYRTIAHKLDSLESLSTMDTMSSVCWVLENVTTDDAIRKAAHEGTRTIAEFAVDALENNKALYTVFKAYAHTVAPHEVLTEEQRYYVDQTMKKWQRNGFDLPDKQFARCSELKKEIATLCQDFQANIASDKRTITVTLDQLAGVTQDFIAQLKTDQAGSYILGVDYPTVDTILSTCSVESTRKALYRAFNNRAYPANQSVLEKLIAARHELAQLLGMTDYNQFSLSNEMVETPQRADAFLQELVRASLPKQQKEFHELLAHLPDGVALSASGKMKPWDVAYIKNSYKKRYLTLDEELIAEYFPMQSTVDGLLHIYEQFFNLKFKRIHLADLWHKELTCLSVHPQDSAEVLGYLLLDLHPRAHKYTHACHISIVPAVIRADGTKLPSVSVVLANFPRESATKPALLKRNDVRTFFHEFGHALHALLGRTCVASFSGTHVKRDFVELPSQMLEEWLWDADILKMISKHYVTGKSLPDELIAKIQTSKTFDSGYALQRQLFFALTALAYYGKGTKKDLKKIWHTFENSIIPDIEHDPEVHKYVAFGHLTGYGPRYYGYLWSQVFALDMFQAIKKEGLLNPAAGKRYVDAVIGRGGSKNPHDLLVTYLGRQPNQHAFWVDQGLL